MSLDDLPDALLADVLDFSAFLVAHFRSGQSRWWVPPHSYEKQLAFLLADADIIQLQYSRGHLYAAPLSKRGANA